jgi:hypothetical protein
MGLFIDGHRIISDIKFTCSCSLLVVLNEQAINTKAPVFGWELIQVSVSLTWINVCTQYGAKIQYYFSWAVLCS